MSGLMSSNPEALDQVTEYLREQNPEYQDQIDQFLESMEEAKARAEEAGVPVPPMEEMGNMGLIKWTRVPRSCDVPTYIFVRGDNYHVQWTVAEFCTRIPLIR